MTLRSARGSAIAVLAAAGIGLRLWVVGTPLGELDADEAIVGLMARHVAQGELPVFYWGQHYGGAIEAFLTVPAAAIAGWSSTAALRAVPLVLHVAAGWLVWRIAVRIVPEHDGAWAAAVWWAWPAYFVWWSLKARGIYAAALVVTLATVLFVVRFDERPSAERAWWVGAGGGLAWFASPQSAFVLIPLLTWLLVRHRTRVRLVGVAMHGVVIGMAPWLLENLSNGWQSVHALPAAGAMGLAERFASFFTRALPASLGLRLDHGGSWLLGPVGLALYVALALTAAKALPKSPRFVRAIAFGYPLLYAASPLSRGEPRYLYLLSPFLVLFAAHALRDRASPLVALVLAASSFIGLAAMASAHTSTPYAPDVRLSGSLAVLARELEARGVRTVFADYWIAYPVTFYSEERVIATPFRGTIRYEPYNALVRSAAGSAYVVPARSLTLDLLEDELRRRSAPYESTRLGDYVLVTSALELDPEEVPDLQSPKLDVILGDGSSRLAPGRKALSTRTAGSR